MFVHFVGRTGDAETTMQGTNLRGKGNPLVERKGYFRISPLSLFSAPQKIIAAPGSLVSVVPCPRQKMWRLAVPKSLMNLTDISLNRDSILPLFSPLFFLSFISSPVFVKELFVNESLVLPEISLPFPVQRTYRSGRGI